MIKLLMSLIFWPHFLWATSSPLDHSDDEDLQPEINLRLIKKQDNFTYLGELKAHKNYFDNTFTSLRLGGYYRLHSNFKAGAFLKHQQGALHDDDWVRTSEWEWDDTSSRGETLATLALVPRTLLSDSLVGEFKTRYVYNFSNDNQTFKLRPGITYFWFRSGRPFLNIYLQYERYIPLNFGNESLYEEWLYLGSMYHYSKSFKPGLFIAQRKAIWTESEEFKEAFPNQNYEYELNNTVLGLTLTWFCN